MDTEDYKKNRAECWKEYCNKYHHSEKDLIVKGAFYYAFDRAYALGMAHPNRTDTDEMLKCPKEKVQDMYAYNEEILKTDPTNQGAVLLKARLTELFGVRCLSSDSAEQTASPSFIAGDVVRITGASTEAEQILIGAVGQVIDVDARNGKCYVLFLYSKGHAWIRNSHLELTYVPSIMMSQPHIVPGCRNGKRDPRLIPSNSGELKMQVAENELRLKIASMAMQGLLASPVDANMKSKSVEYITEASFKYADALIAKSKEGGNI